MRTEILGVGFDNLTLEAAVSRALEIISGGGEKSYVVTPNPEIVWQCRANPELRDAVSGAVLVLPDGVGITLGAQVLGSPLKERIPGIDFAGALLEKLAGSAGRVFLLGAKPGVAQLAGDNLAALYPGIVIAGSADGYFSDDLPVIESVNASKPELLLVCLGSPRQELWMAENLQKLNTRLAIGLGGALDVFSGKVKRAPKLFRILGLEWLFRLLKEPKRIKRMIKLPLFLCAVIRTRFCRNRPR